MVVGFSAKITAAVSRTTQTAEVVSRYGAMFLMAGTIFLLQPHSLQQLIFVHHVVLSWLVYLLFFTSSWPLHHRAEMLAAVLSLPPGHSLGQGSYCQPAGCDQKFMANSAKARLVAAHQLAGSHQDCKYSLGPQAAVAREGEWPCQPGPALSFVDHSSSSSSKHTQGGKGCGE